MYNFSSDEILKDISIYEKIKINIAENDINTLNTIINFLKDFKELYLTLYSHINNFINNYQEILKEE